MRACARPWEPVDTWLDTWCGDNKGDRGKFLGKFYIVCLIATFLITVRSLKLYSIVETRRAKTCLNFPIRDRVKIQTLSASRRQVKFDGGALSTVMGLRTHLSK